MDASLKTNKRKRKHASSKSITAPTAETKKIKIVSKQVETEVEPSDAEETHPAAEDTGDIEGLDGHKTEATQDDNEVNDEDDENDKVPPSAATALTLPATGAAPERFDQLDVSDKTMRALKEDFKFETMTEIQRRTIPASLGIYCNAYNRRQLS